MLMLKSKKGFIVTVIVLAAITGGSFATWLIPQNHQSSITISDPEDGLNALIDQIKTISESDKTEFDKLLSSQITPENYIAIAKISSGQIRSMIISLTEPDVSQEWRQSYYLLGDSLRTYNTYLRETIVIAEKMKENPMADLSENLDKLEQLLAQTQDSLLASNESRPQN